MRFVVRARFSLLLFILSFAYSVQAAWCPDFLAKLIPNSSYVIAHRLMKESPEAKSLPLSVLQAGIRSHRDVEARFQKEGATEWGRLKPFVDIAHWTQDLKSGKMLEVESVGKAIQSWHSHNEMMPYLYGRLNEFGAFKKDLVEWLSKNEDRFFNAQWLNESPRALITYSFEKETHRPQISDWYRPNFYTEAKWLALSPEERSEILKGKGTVLKVIKSGQSLAANSNAPLYLGKANIELHMREYAGTNFVTAPPPVEVRHHSYEIDPLVLFEQMKTVSEKLGENSAFHVHLVFPFDTANKEELRQLFQWWQGWNDRIYLAGVEQGMHPNQLTKLPEPENWSGKDLMKIMMNKGTKFFGLGLRAGMYGDSPISGTQLVGLELRDVAKDLPSTEKLVMQLSKEIASKAWRQQSSTSALLENRTKNGEAFALALMRQNIPMTDIAELMKIEPLSTIPFYDYGAAIRTGSTSAHESEADLFNEAATAYARSLGALTKEMQIYKEKGETVEPELIRSAIRLSLSEWAKTMEPSRVFAPKVEEKKN